MPRRCLPVWLYLAATVAVAGTLVACGARPAAPAPPSDATAVASAEQRLDSSLSISSARPTTSVPTPVVLAFSFNETELTAFELPLPGALEPQPAGADLGTSEAGPDIDATTPFQWYAVQPGDTIASLAARFHIAADSLAWNNAAALAADGSLLPGATLRVPAANGVLYVVGANESLSTIAKQYALTVESIIELPANGITDPNLVVAGSTVLIPGARPSAGGQPAPAVVATEAPAPPAAVVAATPEATAPPTATEPPPPPPPPTAAPTPAPTATPAPPTPTPTPAPTARPTSTPAAVTGVLTAAALHTAVTASRWPAALWPTLERIVMCESGRNTAAVGPLGHRGLLQVDPKLFGSVPTDAVGQLNQGYDIYLKQGWSAWACT